MLDTNTLNHENALKLCASLFDRGPYNSIGNGLVDIAERISNRDSQIYTLTIPAKEAEKHDTLLGLIECFANKQLRGCVWSGLGNTLKEKVAARRKIEYYRLNLVERIKFADADNQLGDQDGHDITTQIEALFPEVSLKRVGEGIELTLHLVTH